MMILPSSVTVARPHELIYNTDSTTDVSGSIILRCRDEFAEPLNIHQNLIKFWLNRTSACDLDLEARDDVQVIRVDDYRIKLNITHNLEGNYTCGQLVAQGAEILVEESDPVTLVCKFTCSCMLVAIGGYHYTNMNKTIINFVLLLAKY